MSLTIIVWSLVVTDDGWIPSLQLNLLLAFSPLAIALRVATTPLRRTYVVPLT